MGNLLEPDYDKLRFMRYSKPVKYLFEIHVTEFNVYTIAEKLDSVKDTTGFVENDKTTIIKVLQHIQKTETPELLAQVDGYLFNKFNGSMPYLAIINTNAVHNREMYKDDGYYYTYPL